MKQQGNFLLLDRSEFRDWLQAQKITRNINTLQVHHTYSPNYTTRKNQDHFKCLNGMRDFHMNTNGWSATGQNITTFEDGKIAISLDRNLNSTPAGIAGANTGSICIENIGDFDKGGDTITLEQKQTIIHLYACLAEKFNLSVDTQHIRYHCWYSVDGTVIYDLNTGKKTSSKSPSKTCPGTNFFGVGNTVESAQKNFIPLVKQELYDITHAKVVKEIMENFSKNFTDVDKEWAASSIDNGVKNGLFAVGADKKFRPNDAITRAEMAVVIDRVVNYLLSNKK